MELIKPEALHLQAYHVIKQSILDGIYQPAERLVESRVASTLGVSRGTIREAFRILIQDGLLTNTDGFVRVYNPTKQDIIDVFQCREGLEMLAVKLAIQNMNDKVKDQLTTNINRVNELSKVGTVTELRTLDQEFHDIIVQSSNNNQLIELMNIIKNKVIYIRNCMALDYFPTFVDDHQKIFHALLEENENQAVSEMQVHMNNALKGVLAHINREE